MSKTTKSKWIRQGRYWLEIVPPDFSEQITIHAENKPGLGLARIHRNRFAPENPPKIDGTQAIQLLAQQAREAANVLQLAAAIAEHFDTYYKFD